MPPSLTKKRIESIDLLRGLVMIIMALDHTRDFFHQGALRGDPLDPATTTPVLYFTRWITHFCAPSFVFLSGLSAWLQSKAGKSNKQLRNFLITRGIWLILVDLFVMTFAISADIHYSFFLLETLWSIGASMIILGLVISLPFNVILGIGLAILLLHNSLDFVEKTFTGDFPIYWKLLHHKGIVPLWGNHNLLVLYPFLPWTGLMLLGYCCGKLFTDVNEELRKKILLTIGLGAILFFIVLRATNWYGDPGKWETQKNATATIFSFMNVQKYPPSLLFLCATIGPGLVFLALVKNTGGRLARIISVYGRAPLFYFVVHIFLLRIAEIIVFLSRGHSWAEGMRGAMGALFKFSIPGEGYSLGVVYIIWVALVLFMYPLCKWYDHYKQLHKEKWWLSYL